MATTANDTPINLNIGAPNVPYFTPVQENPAGTPIDPKNAPTLFQPLQVGGITLHNRIICSPMCQYSAENGFVTPWHEAHLGGIFTRGPAITFVEATAVTPEGRISPEDTGIWLDEHIEPLKRIVDFAHSQNQKIAIQLAHGGRKASTCATWYWLTGAITCGPEARGWPEDVVGPTESQFAPPYPTPKALTKEGIERIKKAFVDGAQRSVQAGFDIIEIHAAHGYLLSSFLSPSSNSRTDEYGGTFENRIRFLIETVDAVKAVLPENVPLFVRVSATEWLEETLPDSPQWTIEDTVRLAPILQDHGVDLFDISSGGNHPLQKAVTKPAYQAPFSHAIMKALKEQGNKKMLVGAVGNIRDGTLAQKILDDGMADVIFAGRAFQKNPGLVWEWADDLGVDIHNAKQIAFGFLGKRGRKGEALINIP